MNRWTWPAVAFAAVAGLGLAVRGQPPAVDRALHRELLLSHGGWVPVTSHLGDTVIVFALAIAAALAFRRDPRARAIPLATVIGWLSYTLLKLVFGRDRPTGGLWVAGGHAFPSGHATMSATLAFVTLLVGWPRARPWQRWCGAVIAAGYVLMIGYTRVAGGVHWPTDILGGWLTAAGCTAVALLVITTRRV
jgi:undecaprenyl-diphosphatase